MSIFICRIATSHVGLVASSTTILTVVTGTLILLYGWIWTDAAMTLLIAGYVLYHGINEIPKVIHLLMEGTPEGINIDDVVRSLEQNDGVEDAHHVHVWQLDEHTNAMEAHILLSDNADMDQVKTSLKSMLHDEFEIQHSTLEFENSACDKQN